MSGRHVRVRIREVTVTGSGFDQAGFRRLLRERLRHERAVDDRQQLRRTVAEAARRSTKGEDR